MSLLASFLMQRLRCDHAVHFESDDCPPWWQEGVTIEVDQSTYDEYLEMLPPRYMDRSLFAFGEGAGPFAIFWSQADRYFVHQLSADDTESFCQLSGAILHQ